MVQYSLNEEKTSFNTWKPQFTQMENRDYTLQVHQMWVPWLSHTLPQSQHAITHVCTNMHLNMQPHAGTALMHIHTRTCVLAHTHTCTHATSRNSLGCLPHLLHGHLFLQSSGRDHCRTPPLPPALPTFFSLLQLSHPTVAPATILKSKPDCFLPEALIL